MSNQTFDNVPQGYKLSAAKAGFKQEGRTDLGLIYSETPCVYAGLFTKNRFCAVPVTLCKAILAQGKTVRAVVANSGQANACTGEDGLANAKEGQSLIANMLKIQPDEVLPLSTGVIGAQIKMDNWKRAMPELEKNLGKRDAEDFTRAFMTTDAFPKFTSKTIKLAQGEVTITVMAKGAGMICPNMATMLCVCLCDADIDRYAWQTIFNRAVRTTFNRVTVDGDTSTNDSILGLANGASGVSVTEEKDRETLELNVTVLLRKTAYMLVKDGEGAKKVLHIDVKGAANDADAELVARSIGNSQLVKTAIYGGDGNWGRIVTAVGYSGASFNPDDVTLTLCGIERFSQGRPCNDELDSEIAELLEKNDIPIVVTLGNGPGKYSLLASDLGHEYVSLNADYRS
ncbi:MAG: bifunctional glutamate N-acetyltransferase/amino-acid acetyltransferase ArgJ [Desulfovibrionaceae bacterium]|nr:bifunctional glutamate N-acetyltransferase/amino-acid acetyltransferase ArgJ [Desulfovibrionaceae bacterium]